MTGVAPQGNPPVEWAEDRNVAWKIEIPGRGLGTPVVWDDRVFVTTAIAAELASEAAEVEPPQEPANQAGRGRRGGRGGRGASGPEPVHEFRVLAVSREDGSVLWDQTARVERPHEGKRDNNTFASASVVTDGENVIAFFGSRGLYCYDMEGNLRWEKDFGDMDIRNDFGEGATPALHGDTLVVTWDHQGQSFIVALDKNTGEELWRTDRDEIDAWATPLVVEHDGVPQVITAGTNRVRSYNLTNGELLWEGDGLTMNPIPSPVSADGVVYLTSGYRGNALRAIRLADAKGDVTGTSAVLWEHNRDTPYVSSPLLYENNLYFLKSNSAILTTLDARTGEPLYDPIRLEGLSEVYASPVGASGRVYLLGRDGNALVIENGPEFKILAQNSLDDGFDASPAIVGEEMYLRGYRSLYKIAEN
jgi:outer membrane protein assembly factor BamB